MSDIKNLLQNVIGLRGLETGKNLDLCKVISVDKSNNTCKALLIKSDIELENVLLSVSEQSSYVKYPAVDSIIVVGWIDSLNPVIVLYSDIEQIVEGVKSNNLTLKVVLDFLVEINTKMAEDLFKAIDQAVWNTSSGPTVPSPQNKVIFEQTLQKYKDDMTKTSDYIKSIYYK